MKKAFMPPRPNYQIPTPEVKPVAEEPKPYNPVESLLKPYCVGCRDIDPKLITEKLWCGDAVCDVFISISCENAERCEHLIEHFKGGDES